MWISQYEIYEITFLRKRKVLRGNDGFHFLEIPGREFTHEDVL